VDSAAIPVAIRRLPGNDDIDLPSHHSAEAAGMDIRAAVKQSVHLLPGEIELIPAGFAIALPSGFEAQIRPRSGLATKHGVTVVNSPGTIDADYRGEVLVALINLGNATFEITRGQRIAQMIVAPVVRVQWNEVKDLPSTSRGSGGFGHTGA
jgi:dUTP pyrophosphatase